MVNGGNGFPLRPLRCFPLRPLREKIKYRVGNGQWLMVNRIIVVYLRLGQIRKVVTSFPLRPSRLFSFATLA